MQLRTWLVIGAVVLLFVGTNVVWMFQVRSLRMSDRNIVEANFKTQRNLFKLQNCIEQGYRVCPLE